ncbi:hypothetical protein P67b_00015 [Ruegeria phage Tedan]|nr:hypothetical protein P67b_00015 [Ruegeria phage Tedan]
MKDLLMGDPEISNEVNQYLIYYRWNGLPNQAIQSGSDETSALLDFVLQNPGAEGAHVKAGPLIESRVTVLNSFLMRRGEG